MPHLGARQFGLQRLGGGSEFVQAIQQAPRRCRSRRVMVIGGVLMIAGVLLGPVRLIDEKQESQQNPPEGGVFPTLNTVAGISNIPYQERPARLASSGL